MRQGLRDVGGTVLGRRSGNGRSEQAEPESPPNRSFHRRSPRVGSVAWAIPTPRMKGRSQEDRPVGGPRKGRRRRVSTMRPKGNRRSGRGARPSGDGTRPAMAMAAPRPPKSWNIYQDKLGAFVGLYGGAEGSVARRRAIRHADGGAGLYGHAARSCCGRATSRTVTRSSFRTAFRASRSSRSRTRVRPRTRSRPRSSSPGTARPSASTCWSLRQRTSSG